MLISTAIDDVVAWLEGPGKDKMIAAFTTIGSAAVSAYITVMKTLGQKSIEELQKGNIKGAAIPAAAMWFLGGGALARGAWGLGKGLFGAGRWALGKLGLGAAGTAAAAEAAATAGTGVGIAGRVLPALGKLKPWLGRLGLPVAIGLEALNIVRAEDKRSATVRGAGRIAGMAAGGKAGMMVGGAIGGLFGGIGAAPGAAIGGLLGGIAGWFGGEAIAERINAGLTK